MFYSEVRWVEVNWLFKYFSHICAVTGGLKKLDLRSGSQRHRHFVGFFNVPVLAPSLDHIQWFRHNALFSRLLRSRWGYGGHILDLTPGPSRGFILRASHECLMTFWYMTNSNFPTNQTFHQFHDLDTELNLHRLWMASMEHLQRVWHASRERLPFRTLGSVPHCGTCLCSNCWDRIPRTCHVFTRLFTSNIPWYFLDFASRFIWRLRLSWLLVPSLCKDDHYYEK